MAGEATLRCEGVKAVYGTGRKAFIALDGVDFEVTAGEFVALTGPSGCGKTTLLYALGGIKRPAEGRVHLNGTELTALNDAAITRLRRDRIGFIFQKFNLLPMLTAYGNVAIMKWLGANVGNTSPEELLEAVGVGDKMNNLPSELSMGEEQRVAVARALYTQPAVILADEPTGSVDSANENLILDIFERYNHENGQTILIATHDPAVAARATRVIKMSGGKIV